MNTIIVLLFFIFILLTYLFFLKINNWDIIAPVSIVYEVTLLCLLVMSFFIGKSGESVSFDTMTVIYLALLSFSLGTIGIRHKHRRVILNKESIENNLNEQYSTSIVVFCFILNLIATLLYYNEVRRIAVLTGFSNDSVYGMLYYYRNASLQENDAWLSQSKAVGQVVIASYASAYLVLVDFVKRIINRSFMKKKFTSLIEIGIMVLFMIQCVLSGGRTQFMYYIESFALIYVFYFSSTHVFNVNRKIIRRISFIMVGSFLSFFVLGSLTGKTSKLNFLDTLYVYAGSSFVAFDKLLHGEVHFYTPYPGVNVFWGIIDILNRLGINAEKNAMAAPFVNMGGVSTNIYGSYARYYNDFGFVGMLIICFLLGMLFRTWYNNLYKSTNNIELKLAMYAIVAKVLFEFCLEERMFLSVVSLGTIIRFFYILVLNYMFKKIKFKVSRF